MPVFIIAADARAQVTSAQSSSRRGRISSTCATDELLRAPSRCGRHATTRIEPRSCRLTGGACGGRGNCPAGQTTVADFHFSRASPAPASRSAAATRPDDHGRRDCSCGLCVAPRGRGDINWESRYGSSSALRATPDCTARQRAGAGRVAGDVVTPSVVRHLCRCRKTCVAAVGRTTDWGAGRIARHRVRGLPGRQPKWSADVQTLPAPHFHLRRNTRLSAFSSTLHTPRSRQTQSAEAQDSPLKRAPSLFSPQVSAKNMQVARAPLVAPAAAECRHGRASCSASSTGCVMCLFFLFLLYNIFTSLSENPALALFCQQAGRRLASAWADCVASGSAPRRDSEGRKPCCARPPPSDRLGSCGRGAGDVLRVGRGHGVRRRRCRRGPCRL